MKVKIKKLKPDVKIPCYAHAGDAGMDLFSQENYVLKPGERYRFQLDFEMEIPTGFVGLYWDKSGLAFNHGLHILGGVIDSTYRGEHMVTLVNLGDEKYEIQKGDKIAQLLIQPIAQPVIELVKKLSDSNRGKKGFGSTGRN